MSGQAHTQIGGSTWAGKSGHLLFEVDGPVATITLNRPEALNAFSVGMLRDWVRALEEIRDREDIRVAILTGAGRAFSAGGDVRAMTAGRGFLAQGGDELDTYSSPLAVKNSLWKLIQRVPMTLETVDKPIIAAINGDAVGAGLDMALMCDLRIAAEGARFSEAYVRLGVVPGDGGAYFLPRLVGVAKALELLLTGDRLGAEEAARIGLVNRVVPDGRALEEARALAARIAAQPPTAVQLIKRAVYQSARADLRTALDLISSHMAVAVSTEEHRQAVRDLVARMETKKAP